MNSSKTRIGWLAFLALQVAGCAATCPDIVAHREAFDARARSGSGVDARLTVPFALFDEVLATELARRPPVSVALPLRELGLSLPVAVVLEAAHLHPAPDGLVGVTLSIGLRDRAARILTLEVDTALRPTFAPGASPSLRITLAPRDVGALNPRATPDAVSTLSDWLRRALPTPARVLVRPELVSALSEELLALVAREVWPRVKGTLLGQAPLLDAVVTLPQLDVREVAFRSQADALVIDLVTGFSQATALPLRDDTVDRRRVALRMSGGTVAGLVNQGMRLGVIPSRFSSAGAVDPHGPYEARLGWVSGPSPLRVHLWRATGSCRRADIAASLSLALRGDAMTVRARDGRYVEVAGPPFASTLAWLDNVFGSALSTSLDVASLVRFEFGLATIQMRVARALLDEDLRLDLELGVRPR